MSEKTIKQITEEFKKLISLTEMSMAVTDKNSAIWVEARSTRPKANRYFKYYNNISYQRADKVARISIIKPEYIKHQNIDGKDDWILTKSEKRKLMILLNQSSEDFPEITNYQYIIAVYNRDNFYLSISKFIRGDYNESDYPDLLSLDYPMPDYMELEK